jgi:hypothetical protein
MGVSSKIGTVALAAQSGKGAPATTPTVKFKLAGSPSLSPRRDTARYATTDRGRDQGLAYISQLRVEGDMPVYLHPSGFWLLMWGVLGAHVAGGTPPNLTDTETPANDLPWFTIWRMVADNLFEKFVDCKLVSMTVEGTAGTPPIATISVLGADSVWETSDTLLEPLNDVPWVYHESCGRIKIDGNAFPISRVQFSVDNNGAGYQADCISLADIDVGNRDVGLTFTTRYVNPATQPSYAETFYGQTNPPVDTHLTAQRVNHAFQWEMYRSTDESILFDFPQVLYQAVEVNPDPGGDPIELEVACDVEKQDDATPILTSTSKWIEAAP